MGTAKPPVQVWESTVDARRHRVELSAGMFPTVAWIVDGERVAEGKISDRKVTLEADEIGSVVVRTTFLGAPRRATLRAPGDLLGGTDLVPETGSPAAVHADAVLAHPGRHTAIATAGAAAGVILPLVIVALLARLAVKLPWPDLPNIPWPDVNLPDINLPGIPWPDIPWPDIDLPGWVVFILDNAHFVVPVIVAFVLARAEVRRRRQQAEEAQQVHVGEPGDA